MTVSETIPELALHVHACRDADCVILLDLRRNRYWGIAASALEGPSAERERALKKLRDSGLLGDDQKSSGVPPQITPCDEDFVVAQRQWRISAGDIRRAMMACAKASWCIRRGRLDLTIDSIKRKKGCATIKPKNTLERDAQVFAELRPWFPAERVCLIDALALMFYLLSLGHRPSLVIAARARPFSAHCWVQQGGAVVGDSVENCRSFVPLLAV